MTYKNNIIPTNSIVTIIDLGSNSFHMIVNQYEFNSFKVIARFMRNVKLAENFSNNNLLSKESITRGLQCIREFAQYLKNNPSDFVYAVATNTLRTAVNRDLFLSEAEAILQYPIKVISGEEEAKLIYWGGYNSQLQENFKRLVIDIGGGSTEYIVGAGLNIKFLTSLQLGCVVFRDKYFYNNKLSEVGFQSAYYAARLQLDKIEKQIKNSKWEQAFGSSGTIRSIYNAVKSINKRHYIIYDDLIYLKSKILYRSNINDINIPKLPPKKRSTFPSGLAILLATFDSLGITQMEFSEGALREGMLYELSMHSHNYETNECTIRELESRYKVDTSYTKNFLANIDYCFSMARNNWGLTDSHLFLITTAARLCRIGIYISYMNYHHHSVYLLNSINMFGFSNEQKKYLTILIKNHIYNISKYILSEAVDYTETSYIKYLILIIRIANILTIGRPKDQQVDYKIEFYDKTMIFYCNQQWIADNPINYEGLIEEAKLLKKTPYCLSIHVSDT
jgi:exopolyphosphatase/guanosine-5'-triphosphate,3'-diphosphate pyrophosphatase